MELIDIIKALDLCSRGTVYCNECPYRDTEKEHCSYALVDDIIAALKELQRLKTPTEEEQPMLPGVFVYGEGEE